MLEKNNSDNEYDSFNDVIEFQENMYLPGYYVGTGKIPPTISAPGNAMPLAILCVLITVFLLAFGLFLCFYEKVVLSILVFLLSLFSLLLGLGYLKKAKRFRAKKKALKEEAIDETVNNKICQLTCPNCGKQYDMDYPKCPNCKFRYLE